MISRRTTLKLSEVYAQSFYSTYDERLFSSYSSQRYYRVDIDKLYDFLFVNDYPAWFCNLIEHTRNSNRNYESATRKLKEFILKLHTGESIVLATANLNWDQRAVYGQKLLTDLAEDILNVPDKLKMDGGKLLLNNLELDGYSYHNSHLFAPESDILDVKEKEGILVDLFKSLNLQNEETAFHHLRLSEEHYLNQNWDDSISNSRKFLECVLIEVAKMHSTEVHETLLGESIISKPFKIREYLNDEGLIEKKEKEVLTSIYCLLSETGSHPYMAKNDQARFLRSLALSLSQFIMIRLNGELSTLQK
jgi:hypothetical protein